MLSRAFFVITLFCTVCLSACSGGPARPPHPVPPAQSQARGQTDVLTPERKIIRNASLTLWVDSVPEAFQAIRDAVPGWGGFLSDSHFSVHGDSARRASLQIRVPAENLDLVLTEITKLGRLSSQSESGEDVTAQYVDLESQLRNLQHTEKRLLELMERTGSVKDLLEAEKEVTRTRGEIERLQGRLKQLEHNVAYSTVNVELYERGVIDSEKFWNLGETVQQAWMMFLHILRAVVSGAIYFIFLLPFALPPWLYLGYRRKKLPVVQDQSIGDPVDEEGDI